MSEDKVRNCNFSCVCNRKDCSYKHRIEGVEKRIQFKEIFDKLYDKSKHNETDPEGVRKINCCHGALCNKDGCNFKHFCNFEGRVLITKEWFKQNKKEDNVEFLKKLEETYEFSAEDLAELKKRLFIK